MVSPPGKNHELLFRQGIFLLTTCGKRKRQNEVQGLWSSRQVVPKVIAGLNSKMISLDLKRPCL